MFTMVFRYFPIEIDLEIHSEGKMNIDVVKALKSALDLTILRFQ